MVERETLAEAELGWGWGRGGVGVGLPAVALLRPPGSVGSARLDPGRGGGGGGAAAAAGGGMALGVGKE